MTWSNISYACLPSVYLLYFFNTYFLFIWLHWVWVVACGIQFPDQGLNSCLLHSEHGVLITGPSGKCLCVFCNWVVHFLNIEFQEFFVYFRASQVVQLVKNLPAMWETWVRSLGWEDPLEKGNSYPLQHSGLENSKDCIVCGVTKSRTELNDFHFTLYILHDSL